MEPIDLVQLATDLDLGFDASPSERCDPQLFALIEDDDGLAVGFYGDVGHIELSRHVVPPPGCKALILTTTGWSAPMEPDGSFTHRPSLHPQRKRCCTTTVIGNDGDIVSVLRIADEEPQVLTEQCVGRVPDALRQCWSRRSKDAAA